MELSNFNKKIKVVAIAKDEAAYLPIWLFHHFYFGFDEIDVYVNNTSDNSVEILGRIAKKYPVNLVDADFLFEQCQHAGNIQECIYDFAYQKSLEENVGHILFVDIDEFWSPLDFRTSIRKCLHNLNNPDILSLEWVFKRDELTPFSNPYSCKMHVNKNHMIKSIFRTDIKIKKINVHNVVAEKATNILGDGRPHPKPYRYVVDNFEINHQPIKPYFILHRFWRSQIEYVAMLGQGMKQSPSHDTCILSPEVRLKSNRVGYLLPENRQFDLLFDRELIKNYDRSFDDFVEECGIEEELRHAKQFVIDRAKLVLETIIDRGDEQQELVMKIMKNVDVQSLL